MRKIRDLLRLHFECSLSNKQIGDALGISKTCVYNAMDRFTKSGLSWPLPADLADSALEDALYKNQSDPSQADVVLPDFEHIYRKLSRPHVTLKLLFDEYRAQTPTGLSKTAFYRRFDVFRKKLSPTMKIIHKGGDKLFVDYSGDSFEYVNRETGEILKVQLFVCCWGASSYSYAEVTASQSIQDWLQSHARALSFFGCAPHAFVIDNLKSGVTKSHLYDPDLNPLYAKLAEHYGVAVLPARVRKPKDKAVVESNVLHLQRHLLGRLRDRTFFSIAEINEAIAAELTPYNDRPMQQYGVSRRIRFEQLDKPYAQTLPAEAFAYTQVKNAVVAPDYHIELDKHFYSVPFSLVGQAITVYQTNNTLEFYSDGLHVCRYRKEPPNFRYTTKDEHMPPNHRAVRGWSASGFILRAGTIGPATSEAVKIIIDRQKHPEQGFRAARGVLALDRKFPKERIERACQRAIRYNAANYRTIKTILDKKLDEQPLPECASLSSAAIMPLEHENIRGAQYYEFPEQQTLSL
jgi:transposase